MTSDANDPVSPGAKRNEAANRATAKPPGPTKKERLKLPQQVMTEQLPEIRIHNMQEVPLGFSAEQAKVEAARSYGAQVLLAGR